ncbi:MAG: hypothetical protein HY043_20955 [Verrucomicrobia bacterium]|nr:hypothetical protein [Verrucomicrobiota bacterium]
MNQPSARFGGEWRGLFGWLLLLVGAHTSWAADLTRQEVVEALLSPASGIALGADSAAWSPFKDFGFGSSHEGMLPSGAVAEPHFVGVQPWPGPPLTNSTPSYFFWIDDEPAAEFMHLTRFVFVTTDQPNPTVANGGIRVAEHGWWPRLRLPDGNMLELWGASEQRTSAAPAGFSNRDGLVSGEAPVLPVAARLNAQTQISRRSLHSSIPPPGSDTACALIVRGAPDEHMSNNVVQFRKDLIEQFGVPDARIKIAKGGGVSSCADLVAAIQDVCKIDPPCSRIYVRITSHGGWNCLVLGNECVYDRELCYKLQTLAAKGAPIHMLINACFSFSLVDTNTFWNFPEGSSIITSAHENKVSYGGAGFTKAGGVTVSLAVSLFADAFSDCLKALKATNKVATDVETYAWVTNQQPCYPFAAAHRMLYPAGSRTNRLAENPFPQKVVVGRPPQGLALHVQNGTGEEKSDFHMIFQGNVTKGGKAEAKRADANGAVKVPGNPWGTPQITFNSDKNETMVCWDAPNDHVRAGDFILFRYSCGVPVRYLRGYWTPTTDPPADKDKIPTKSASLGESSSGDKLAVRQVVRADDAGGWSLPWQGRIGFAVLDQSLAIEDLHFGNPLLLQAATNFLNNAFSLEPDHSTLVELPLSSVASSVDRSLVFISQFQSGLNQNRTFVFELFDLPATKPVGVNLQARRLQNEIEIAWSGSGTLQTTDSLNDPWQDVPGQPQGNFRAQLQGAARFFRLKP